MPGRPAVDQVEYARARAEINDRLLRLGIEPGLAGEEATDLMRWFVSEGWRQVRPPVLEPPPAGDTPADLAPSSYAEAREQLRATPREEPA